MIVRGRLNEPTLVRGVEFGSRILGLVEQMERDKRPRRVVDQLTGSGTSPGAQLFEAHEALSKADIIKILGICAKELSETRCWLQIITARQWYHASRIEPLLAETIELLKIVKTLIARARGPRT